MPSFQYPKVPTKNTHTNTHYISDVPQILPNKFLFKKIIYNDNDYHGIGTHQSRGFTISVKNTSLRANK